MAPLTNMLAGLVALSGPVSARVFQPGAAHQLAPRHDDGNLISLGADGSGVPDDSLTIRAPADNEILKPIRPTSTASQATKGASTKDTFGLRKEDRLYWGGKSGTVAELRVDVSGEKEGLVDMEQFDDLVESLECPQDGGKLSIRFKDQVDFDSAADVWDWVNQQPDHNFLLMAGAGDCGWNDDRVLYRVKDLDFSDDENTAILNTDITSWKEAIHTFDLNIGKAAQNQAARRDISPEFSVPFDFDLTGKGFVFNMNGVDYMGSCANCTSVGSFDMEARFSMEWFDITEATVSVSTPGITTTAIIEATIRGELTDELLEKEWPMFKASPAGISIPGIVSIGPTVSVNLRAGVNAIKGGVKLTLGGTATIPPSSATLDFLSEEGTTSEGWEIEAEAEPLEADVFVEARAYTSLTPALALEISAFETGFSAEITTDVPVLAAVLRAIHSMTCTACDEFENAVEGSITLGTNIGVALKKKTGGTLEDLWSLTFFDASLPPLASFCEAVGPQNCENNGTANALRRM